MHCISPTSYERANRSRKAVSMLLLTATNEIHSMKTSVIPHTDNNGCTHTV